MKNRRGLGCNTPMGATLFERMFPQVAGISASGPVGKSPYFGYPGTQLEDQPQGNPMGHSEGCNCDACDWMTDVQYPASVPDRGTPTDYPGRLFKRINRSSIDGSTMWDDMWGGPYDTVECKVPNVQGPGGADVTTYTDGEPLQNYWNGNKATPTQVSTVSPVAAAPLCSVYTQVPVQTSGNTLSPVSTPATVATSPTPGQSFDTSSQPTASLAPVQTIANTMPATLAGNSYTIAPGDTLALIAITTGIDVATLVSQNPILDGYGQMDDLSGLAGNLLAIPSTQAPIAQSYSQGVTAASVNPASPIPQAVTPTPTAVSLASLTVAPPVVIVSQPYNDAVAAASISPISQVAPLTVTGATPPVTQATLSVSPTVVGQESLADPISVPVSVANAAAQSVLSSITNSNSPSGLAVGSLPPLATVAIAAALIAFAYSIPWSSAK